MKRILCFLGSAIYGVIVGYVLWLLFGLLSAWVINWKWWAIILYIIVGNGILFGIIQSLSALLVVPLVKMGEVARHSKWLPIISLLFFGYCSAAAPWHLHPTGFRQVVICISVCISAIEVFVPLIVGIWKNFKE